MSRTEGSPSRPAKASKSKAEEDRRPDFVSQYLALLAQYHKKSSESNDEQYHIEISTDIHRVYLPTQTVMARIGLSKKALQGDDGFEEVAVEFKGEIHAYGKSFDGTAGWSFQTDTLFNHKVILHSSDSNAASQSQGNQDTISAKEAPRAADSNSDSDLVEWQVKSYIPSSVDIQTPNGVKSLAVPTTFKDKFQSPSNFVVYLWKVTGVKKGKFNRSVRKWLPILMPSFAQGPPPDLSIAAPPSYNEGSRSSVLNLPSNWISKTIKHKVRKGGLLFEKQVINFTFSSPEPKNVTSSPLPFILKVEVTCKDKTEFEKGGNVRLPKLPLEGMEVSGEEEWIPTFDLRRVDDSQATQTSAGFNASEQTTSILKCNIEWNSSHLSAERKASLPSRAQENSNSSATSDSNMSQSTVNVATQNGNLSERLEKFNLGQAWSEPALVQKQSGDEPEEGKGKGKLFGIGKSTPQERWQRTAICSGRISANVVPTLGTPNLRTKYVLSVYWGIPSLAAAIQEDLCEWSPSSGISASMLNTLTTQDLTRRIAGPNLHLLLSAGKDGISGREVGRNSNPTMGGMNYSESEFGMSRSSVGTYAVEEEKGGH